MAVKKSSIKHVNYVVAYLYIEKLKNTNPHSSKNKNCRDEVGIGNSHTHKFVNMHACM